MFRKAVFLCYANNFFSGNFVWWCFFLTPQLCWKLLMDKKIYNSDYCFKHLSRSLFMNVLKNHRGLYESITAWRKYRQKNQLISNRKQTQMKIFRSRTLFKSDRVFFINMDARYTLTYPTFSSSKRFLIISLNNRVP